MFSFYSYCFLVCTFEVILGETRTGENIFNNNGWTPITREKVYSSFDERLFPKGKVTEARNQSTNDLGYSQRSLDDLKYARKFSLPSYMNLLDNSFMSSQISSNSAVSDYENHEDINNEHLIVSNTKRHREPKAILSGNTQLMDANLQNEKMFTEKDRKDNIQPSIIDHEKQYQVTESEEQKERVEKQDSETIKHLVKEPSNNHFDIINKTEEDGTDITTNELTDKLLSILSSYNIRVNDKLSNYDLSRHSTRIPTAQEYMLVPIPMRLSNRYNSLNHLPVDPLLAVLLSNYGYYLPGQYGINNKYYNLYGYLASNNIHNNKPFGSYKIFADTDSWN